jgi:hypothetical protein
MDWFATQCDQLRAMFGEFFASRVTEAIMSLVRPALRLSSDLPAERSRLGGQPVLPAGQPWPTWDGRPLDFLGVIDFAELASMLWLPELPGMGTAAFYYVTEMPRPWGDDPTQSDGWRVLLNAGTPADRPATSSSGSAGSSSLQELRPGPATPLAQRLGAAPFVSLPSPHEPALWPIAADVDAFPEVYPQLYESWASFTWGSAPRHQAGGWPMVVQRAFWRDCALAAAGQSPDERGLGGADAIQAERDWRLLLQLDSDGRFGWHWGETGFVYFSARAADVRSGALDRSWLILQATA